MKITNLKKAVGDYQRANKGGYYDPTYGLLMLNKATGELWTDEFYDLGHNSYKAYDNADIINIGKAIATIYGAVTMQTVKKYIETYIA